MSVPNEGLDIHIKYATKELEDRISQLESDKAELQRVVKVKDEALATAQRTFLRYVEIHLAKTPPDDGKATPNMVLAEKMRIALELTPKDLPAFIPEEEHLKEVVSLQNKLIESEGRHYSFEQEYLRVKEENETLKLQIRTGICIDLAVKENEFDLLKSHAEAMAVIVENEFPPNHPKTEKVKEFRKDFPK